MSKIFQLEGGQYEHPNEYKLVSTVRGTTILQPEFGTVIIEGDVIEASTHNTIQKNGVLASKVNVTMKSTDTVLVPTDMTIESDLFNELKIILLFETGTTLPSNSFIKLKETNVPIANVNDYIVNANTPLLFLYFDSKFYAYKAGEGAESLGDLSDVTLTSPTSGQALVYNGSKFVNKTVDFQATETINGTSKIATQSEVNEGVEDTKIVTSKKLNARLDSLFAGITSTYVKLTQLATETVAGITKIATQTEVDNGLEDTKIVTSKKLKARLDSLLAGITSTFVKLTQLATESIAGIIKISTTAQVSVGTDNTTAVSPAKLIDVLKNTYGINKSGVGYVRYADGTQICYGSGTISTINVSTTSAILNFFPLAFFDIPVVNVVHLGSDPNAGSNVIIDSAGGGHNELTGFKSRSTYPNNTNCRYIAIGKWK